MHPGMGKIVSVGLRIYTIICGMIGLAAIQAGNLTTSSSSSGRAS